MKVGSCKLFDSKRIRIKINIRSDDEASRELCEVVELFDIFG